VVAVEVWRGFWSKSRKQEEILHSKRLWLLLNVLSGWLRHGGMNRRKRWLILVDRGPRGCEKRGCGWVRKQKVRPWLGVAGCARLS
jgi:hypothetical protein